VRCEIVSAGATLTVYHLVLVWRKLACNDIFLDDAPSSSTNLKMIGKLIRFILCININPLNR
jgi:hypothetical protein